MSISRKILFHTALASVAWVVLSCAALAAQGPTGVPPQYQKSWDEYQQMLKLAHGGIRKTATTIPDWTGIWIRDPKGLYASFDDSAGVNPLLGGVYGRNTASLTPKYQAAYDQKVAAILAGKEWDRISNCLPAGFPRMLTEPFLREFIVTPLQVWITHEQINETRRVYTDGRGHVPEDAAVPLWLGDSIGFWDGDTLVVHTEHLKAGQYQRGEPDFSFQISTVERIRKTGANTLEDAITVYDPPSLTRPWHAVLHYVKETHPDVRINYDACEENNNVVRGSDGSTQYVLPGNKNYRDPDTFGIPPVAQDSLPK